MNPTLVFDIETIPDIAGLRALYELDSAVSDAEVAEMAFQMRRQKTGSDFLPHHLQRVAAISCVLREGDNFKVWTLGEMDEDEGSIIQRFFDGIEKYTPQIVSVERQRFRPAGAALSRPDPRHPVLRATGIRARTTRTSSGTTTSAATTRAIST